MVKYTIADAPDMQSVASGTDGCPSTLPTGQAYELTDSRDGTTYKVAKLADNKCWMLDNLALDLTDATTMAALTPSNTNADADSLTSLRSGNRTTENPQYASAGFATWDSNSTANVYNQAKANAAYKNTVVTSYGSGSGKVGVYYNYCAASAGSYCYNDGAAPAGTNASQDICPKGWKIPSSVTNGDYEVLFAAYGKFDGIDNFRIALSVLFSGSFGNGSVRGQNENGFFWSSTRSGTSGAYALGMTSSSINTSGYMYRDDGKSVRCLLQ
jgi:uncharacterized protein (TIGR02145 family)